MTRYGFTLIEVSIVLVIIGLIVGGILTGRDLISSSQIRAQIAQFEKFNQSVNTFKGKYNCLPGDCINFTSYFPSFAPSKTFGAGNGDGDDKITDLDGGATGINTTGYPESIREEPILFWMQLFTAGLTTCCDPAIAVWNVNTIGTNFPEDKIHGYGISAANMLGRNGYYWGITMNNNSIAYGNNYLTLSPPAKTVLTPAQANSFDTKIDDGSATTGNVYTAWVFGGDNRVHPLNYHGASNCTTNTTPPNYNITYTSTACNLWVNMQ